MRIIKTKRAIFTALIELFKSKSLYDISITELCKTALINRKTFYSHYESVEAAYADLELFIIRSYLSILERKKIIGKSFFNPSELIFTTNRLVEEDRERFELIFKYMRKGLFMRRLGSEAGFKSIRYSTAISDQTYIGVYCYTFVFAFTGLLTSYFDWIEFGRQIPIEELADTAKTALSNTFTDILVIK